jgi:hypothetical protein
MRQRVVKQEPGCSWIEVNKKVHTCLVADKSHPQIHEIYAELERLIKEPKIAGYVPDTRLVTHDVDEQQPEESLCSHNSEKLAIAYGLISPPPPPPEKPQIRIFKDLQICKGCHTASKLISKVVDGEIVAWNANCFHHFKDGKCSCGDF